GGSPAMVALLGGEVDFLLDAMSAAIPQVKAGKVRPLAVTSAARTPELQDVPTLREMGLSGFESLSWFAMYAPSGTPGDVLTKLRGMLANSMKSPEILDALAKAGLTPANPNH